MDPVSLGIAGVSAALGAAGKISAGNAAAAQQTSLSQDATYQATIARQNSAEAISQAGAQSDAQAQQARYQLGEQAASIGQSGVVASQGSASAVERQSAINKELQGLNIRYQGQVQSTGDLNQAAIETQQAQREASNASYAKSSSYLSATGSVLQGAGSYLGLQSRMPVNTAGWLSQG